MILVADPNGNSRKQPRPGNIPSVSELTSIQITHLLTIISTLGNYCVKPDNVSHSLRIDPGVELAASTSFIKACNNLDDILDDKRRWSLDTYDKLEASILALHELQATQILEASDAMMAAQRPCILLKPSLRQFEDGVWKCKYGKGAGCLTGYGKTPAEAALAFDAEYYGLQAAAAEEEAKKQKEQKEQKKK